MFLELYVLSIASQTALRSFILQMSVITLSSRSTGADATCNSLSCSSLTLFDKMFMYEDDTTTPRVRRVVSSVGTTSRPIACSCSSRERIPYISAKPFVVHTIQIIPQKFFHNIIRHTSTKHRHGERGVRRVV
jgi:hypothetical protein